MKKKITITLYTSEILHDVENTAFLTGKAKRADGNEQNVALMQASEDSEDSDRIMRSIGSAYNTLFSTMSEYIVDNTADANNVLWDRTKDLVINLMMPSNFNLAETDSISSAATDYVANRALGDWFGITSPDSAEAYYTMAAASLESLKRALSRRVRPIRLNPEEGMLKAYIGIVQEDFEPNETSVPMLEQRKVYGKKIDFGIDFMDYDKICYAYPRELGELASITDNNNYNYIDSFATTIVRINGEEYICYVLINPISIDSNIVLRFR